jgi:hypothetical protein
MNGSPWHRTGRNALMLGALGCLVAGCATGGKGPPAAASGECGEHGPCVVNVAVTNCQVSVDIDLLYVVHGPQTIEWRLADTSPASFTASSITFKSPNNEFIRPVVDPHGKWLRLIDVNNRSPDPYYYTITVAVGSQSCRLDPGIVNRG